MPRYFDQANGSRDLLPFCMSTLPRLVLMDGPVVVKTRIGKESRLEGRVRVMMGVADSPRAASSSSMALASGTMPGSIIAPTSPSRTNPTIDVSRFTAEVVFLFPYPLMRIRTSADEAPGRSRSVAMVPLAFLATDIAPSAHLFTSQGNNSCRLSLPGSLPA